jgi:D-threo-aldose 1-dehydrogenase
MTFEVAQRKRVGTRDVWVSRLGIGTSAFGALGAARDDEVVAATMRAATAAGLRYFDTAPFYGHGLAEHRLGQGLRGITRDDVVVSTKVGRLFKPPLTSPHTATRDGARPFAMVYDYTYDATLRSIEDSLLRLDTGRIDVALIHDVNRRWQGDQLEARYREAMAGAYRALDALRAQGVIKAIGVGVNDWEILLRFAADADFDCFMLAGRYTLLDHSSIDRFLPECARRGIAVLAAAPYNSGILATGARPGATFFYTEASPDIMERTRRIEAVCARHGVPLAAAALQFAAFHPAVASVVVGMRNATDIVENVGYFQHPIPAQFWQELKAEGLIADAAPTALTT